MWGRCRVGNRKCVCRIDTGNFSWVDVFSVFITVELHLSFVLSNTFLFRFSQINCSAVCYLCISAWQLSHLYQIMSRCWATREGEKVQHGNSTLGWPLEVFDQKNNTQKHAILWVCTTVTRTFCLMLALILKSHRVTLPKRPTGCQITLCSARSRPGSSHCTCMCRWMNLNSSKSENEPTLPSAACRPPIISESNAQTFIWQLDRYILHLVCSWKKQLLLGYHFGYLATGAKPRHVCLPPTVKARANIQLRFSFAYKRYRGARCLATGATFEMAIIEFRCF